MHLTGQQAKYVFITHLRISPIRFATFKLHFICACPVTGPFSTGCGCRVYPWRHVPEPLCSASPPTRSQLNINAPTPTGDDGRVVKASVGNYEADCGGAGSIPVDARGVFRAIVTSIAGCYCRSSGTDSRSRNTAPITDQVGVCCTNSRHTQTQPSVLSLHGRWIPAATAISSDASAAVSGAATPPKAFSRVAETVT